MSAAQAAINWEESQEPVKPFSEIPGEPGLPIIGNTIPMVTSPVGWLDQWYAKYGPVSRTRSAGNDIVLLLGPEMVREVLLNPSKKFSSRQGLDLYMNPFFKNGLVLWDGAEHQQHRGIMMAAFRQDRLSRYVDEMNPIIERHIDKWGRTRSGRELDRRTFFFFNNFKKMALEIATEVFMGKKVDKNAAKLIADFQAVVAASMAIVRVDIPFSTYGKGLAARKRLEHYFYSHIKEKRANPGNDLFSQLCLAEDDEGQRFTDEQIVDHMIFLMMAAHDTTTLTTTRTIYHLAQNQDWQDEIRNDCVAHPEPYLTFGEMPSMQRMDWCIKEALRMCAPVPGLPRMAAEDIVLHGYHIPAGTTVQVDMRHTHFMEEFWPEPNRFDPLRYADGGLENKVHRYAWSPFGGGVHTCIGRHFGMSQVRAFVYQFIQKYRFTVRDGYKMPMKNPGLPMPGDGFPLRIERL